MNENYYREKIVKLHSKLFLSLKDVRYRFIENDYHWESAYFASRMLDDKNIKEQWNKIWSELTFKKSPYDERSDFIHTILSKRKSSLEKYLYFVLEQYGEVIRK